MTYETHQKGIFNKGELLADKPRMNTYKPSLMQFLELPGFYPKT